jgi:hypothetical protein
VNLGELLFLVLVRASGHLAWLVNEKWEKIANKTARPEWRFIFSTSIINLCSIL